MSSTSTEFLRPVSMPRDARPIMKFTGELADAIEQLLRDAADGRWDKPVDVKLDPRNPESLAHWLYKSMNPVIHGMCGPDIDVEALLKPYKQTRFDFLPSNFSVETEISMSASGDLMCTPGLDGAKDRLFHSVSELIFGADISYANLESTLTTGEVEATEFTADSTPKINLTPTQYETVVSHEGRHFDIVHLANNHILDCGEEGILTTLARLDQDGIAQVGVNRTADQAAQPRITELAGLRIGWVAHTFSVNFKPFPADKPWIVNMTPFHLEPDPDIGPIEAQIKACREACGRGAALGARVRALSSPTADRLGPSFCRRRCRSRNRASPACPATRRDLPTEEPTGSRSANPLQPWQPFDPAVPSRDGAKPSRKNWHRQRKGWEQRRNAHRQS